MTEERVSPEYHISEEIGPRYKILVVQLNPEAKPEMQIAGCLFGLPEGKKSEISDYSSRLLVSRLQTSSSKEEPDKPQRELAADKNFTGREFFRNNPEEVQGIVITGSPFSPYPRLTEEGKPFLTLWKREIITFMRRAVEQGVPILGICFGAQILAEALGGETEQMKTKEAEEVWEWGWSVIKRMPGSIDDPVMRGLPEEFVAAQNHKDCISRLPENGVLLAENQYGIQGFRIDNRKGEPVGWGFQFHPERTPEEVNRFLFIDPNDQKSPMRVQKRRQELAKAGLDPDKIASLAERHELQCPQVTIIFNNFLEFVRSKAI